MVLTLFLEFDTWAHNFYNVGAVNEFSNKRLGNAVGRHAAYYAEILLGRH